MAVSGRLMSRMLPWAGCRIGRAESRATVALVHRVREFSASHALSQDTKSTPREWKLGRLNHVAIAVPDLEKASKLYRDVLGAEVSDVTPLPEHGVCTVFVNLGNTKIELLHPLGENSPIESFMKKKPDGGMHHICIEVNDIRAAIKGLEGKVRSLNPEPRIGAHGKLVVFLHPKDCNGVLIELEEA